MHFAHFVNGTCIIQNALSDGGLAGVNMRGNTNVTRPLHGSGTLGGIGS